MAYPTSDEDFFMLQYGSRQPSLALLWCRLLCFDRPWMWVQPSLFLQISADHEFFILFGGQPLWDFRVLARKSLCLRGKRRWP